jgi:hypothetical protein
MDDASLSGKRDEAHALHFPLLRFFFFSHCRPQTAAGQGGN